MRGNALLFIKIKNDLSKWTFDKSAEPGRAVMLETETDYSNKKLLILPYRLEIKLTVPEVVSYIPADWKEGSHNCEIHQEILKKERLEIIYGSTSFPFDFYAYEAAEPKLFPHANDASFGGCIIDDESPKYVEVLYCERCRAAKSDWIKKQRKENKK
jgi:hypothetical protein